MGVKERAPRDRSKLRKRIGKERDAKQRDRYRAALLAMEGEETDRIAESMGRKAA